MIRAEHRGVIRFLFVLSATPPPASDGVGSQRAALPTVPGPPRPGHFLDVPRMVYDYSGIVIVFIVCIFLLNHSLTNTQRVRDRERETERDRERERERERERSHSY
jgi:hypothetical protein